MSRHALVTTEIRREEDVVLARQRTRQVAALLGFDGLEQTRLATAGGGTAEFSVEGEGAQSFVVRVRDRGPGIRDLRRILEGEYTSRTGMGVGILGARRLSDSFEIESVTFQFQAVETKCVVLGSRTTGMIV